MIDIPIGMVITILLILAIVMPFVIALNSSEDLESIVETIEDYPDVLDKPPVTFTLYLKQLDKGREPDLLTSMKESAPETKGLTLFIRDLHRWSKGDPKPLIIFKDMKYHEMESFFDIIEESLKIGSEIDFYIEVTTEKGTKKFNSYHEWENS